MKMAGTKIELENGDFVLVKKEVQKAGKNFLRAIGTVEFIDEVRSKDHNNIGVKTYDIENDFVPRFRENDIAPIDEFKAMDLLAIWEQNPVLAWQAAQKMIGELPTVELDVPWHTESDYNEDGELVVVEMTPEERAAEEALYQSEVEAKSGPCQVVKPGRVIEDAECDLVLPDMKEVKEEPKHEVQLGFDPAVEAPTFVEVIPGIKVLLYGMTSGQKQANVGLCNFVAQKEGKLYWNQHLNKSMRGTTPYISIGFALKQQDYAAFEIGINKLFQDGKMFASCSRTEIEKLLKA